MRTWPLLVATLLIAAPSQARAQAAASPVDARWLSWLGCWTPGVRPGLTSETTLCIVPDAGGVRMVTFTGEREVLAETIVAEGSTQALRERDCAGERVTRWSGGGARLLSTSSLNCQNQPQVKTTGISSLLSAEQWLDVQVANTGGREQVRTRRFWRSTSEPPAAVASALRGLTAARVATAPVTVDDVIDVSTVVAPVGVEAWLAESGARVPLDRRALVQLSDAQVLPRVIDLMVALAYPQKFEVRRSRSGGSGSWSSGWFDDFYAGEWGYLADVYGYGFGSFGLPYFIGANGYGYYPGGFSYVPLDGGGGTTEGTTHGQVVNGQGYTRVQPREAVRTAPLYQGVSSQGSSGSGGGGSDGGSAGNSGSSGGSSGASPAGYSGGGGGSTGLTAVPR